MTATLSHGDLVVAARILKPTMGGATIDMVSGRPWIIFNSGAPSPSDGDVLNAALTGMREQTKTAIDAAAETARQAFLTPGAGQAMEYQEVAVEAEKLATDEAPTNAAYPMLAAAIGADLDPNTGQATTDIAGVARAALAAKAAWTQIGSVIRSLRLKAKADVDTATTTDAVRAVLDNIVWPAP